MKGILKWPLVIAAIVVVARVLAERAGAPDWVSNLLSVVALHLVIAPLYFAFRIGFSDLPRPYISYLKSVVLYVVLVRAMVLPTYWLARVYEWSQPRFAGLWGPDVSPITGYFLIPCVTAGIWIVVSTIFGGILGSILIAIIRQWFHRTS